MTSLTKEKSAGVDNIPAELVQAGGKTLIDVLTGSGEQENALPHELSRWLFHSLKRQFAARLPNYQPHQSFEQRHAESHLE